MPIGNPSGYQVLQSNAEESKLIYQGTKFDFRYADNAEFRQQGFIIWPEFEDPGGFIILGKWTPIEPSGTARMWIVNRDFVDFHRQYLKIGIPGYMISGGFDVAKCEVIELNNLA